MVESKRHEGEDGPPDTHDLGCQVTALQTEEAGQTHEPVAPNPAQEDHSEVWSDLLLGSEGDHGGLEGVRGEYIAV